MKIKNISIEDKIIRFDLSPLFTTKNLVKRCRDFVDEYYTFTNFERYSQNYNFRKCCLEADIDNYLARSITITELRYKDMPFQVQVFRDGRFLVISELTGSDFDCLKDRCERILTYAM